MAEGLSLRSMRDEDLATLFEIQRDDTAQQLAAFTDATAQDREAYLRKWRRILADDGIVKLVAERGGEIVGSVGTYPIGGDTEVTYWIRKDCWGRGVATAAVALLLREVTVRPLHGRTAADNVGSIRVLERNGFVHVGSERSFAAARQETITELILRRD
ncbi:GNAT family N-acetyltransferase [Saccharomonospora halophila]|uniref:GNAT family N-acetyltransferase n=1 Tax=Saccharomonospora halophila TaxID=129922 RepID=UPI0003AB426F|nr:GNAT family N-acetyltransferase [Saccharomonospora halophila]